MKPEDAKYFKPMPAAERSAASLKRVVGAKRVTIELTSRGYQDMETLVATGLYGVNINEAARRILEAYLWDNTLRIKSLRSNEKGQP